MRRFVHAPNPRLAPPLASGPRGWVLTQAGSPAPPAPGLAANLVLAILCLPVAVLVLSTLLFALGAPLCPWHLPAAILLALGGLALGVGPGPGRWRRWGAAAALLLVLLGALAWLSGLFNDFSYDGQCYHQLAILSLGQGWNPLWEPVRADHIYPVTNYPKGAELLAASVLALTGQVEQGKLFNFLFPLAAGLAIWVYLGRLGLGPWIWRLALSLLAAATPTVLAQIYSFYLDGIQVALLSLLLVFLLAFVREGQTRDLVQAGLAALFLFNLKFTGLVYGGLIMAGFWLWLVWRDRRWPRRLFITGLLGFGLGVLLLGCNPYVFNTITHGSPFYPMPGTNVAQYQAPASFMAHNRVVKLALSLAAATSGNMKSLPQAKLPFTISARELDSLGTTSLRYGGMGTLFSGVLLLLPLAAWLVGRRDRPALGAGLLLSALLLATMLAISEPWYSRFIPQLWLVPMPWLVLCWLRGGRAGRALALILAGVLILNLALILTFNLRHWRATQTGHDRQVQQMLAWPGVVEVEAPWLSVRHRLLKAGLRPRWRQSLDCPRPSRLMGTHARTRYCLR